MVDHLEQQYKVILQAYLEGEAEDELYLAQQLSKCLVTRNVAPEDIIDFHQTALEQVIDLPEPIKASFRLLTEVMIEYGNTYREHLILRSKQQQLQAEIGIAVTMQQALLPSKVPVYEEVEIGIVSVPSKQMSGDYYHFVQQDRESFSVAVADITGKGIPAALCMSMIKFGMDSGMENGAAPSVMMRHLNRVVERNIDTNMFITMLYGIYDLTRHRFRYSVAGHEPGYLYRASDQRFVEMKGQGRMLGVTVDANYQESEIELEPGDYLFLMTDGVTEYRIGSDFLQKEELIAYMRTEIGSSAQAMADNLYKKLLFRSNFEVPDDYTMIVIHRI